MYKLLMWCTIPITAILYTLHLHYVWWVCLISPDMKRTYSKYKKYQELWIFDVTEQIKWRYNNSQK